MLCRKKHNIRHTISLSRLKNNLECHPMTQINKPSWLEYSPKPTIEQEFNVALGGMFSVIFSGFYIWRCVSLIQDIYFSGSCGTGRNYPLIQLTFVMPCWLIVPIIGLVTIKPRNFFLKLARCSFVASIAGWIVCQYLLWRV
jgi:hypothetical protein